MLYGSILKACRERKGWNQEEMAHRLHVNQSDISKYENNVKEPPMSLFQKWALVTGSQDVLVAYMLGVEGVTILTTILSTVGTAIVGGFINLGGLL
ncbi:helix-turn-helix transcriptional regulator [Sporosarcina sp. USHLN248]|uniref:helix-turn-helix domain-containing protein n=1 Tax=Sporosarcina sp. USHLN248 TaxID=3081300 RepID=UPI003016283E